MNSENLTLLLLVFSAVAALAYVVVSTLETAAAERTDGTPGQTGKDAANRSGNPLDVTASSFPFAAFTTPRHLIRMRLFSGYAVFALLLALLPLFGLGPLLAGAVALVAALVAARLPLLRMRRLRRKRLELAASQVLDLTTGLAGGLRSGQALPAALESISSRLPHPMSEEIAVVLREYRLGLDLPDALARLAQRVPCEDLTLLVGSIRLTQQAGGSLAEVLDKMVEMIRSRTEFQAKLKTMTAQGRFEAIAMSLAPLVVFLLLFFIDRPLMLPLVTTATGWTAIVLDALWVLVGFLIIDRIVTIEV